MSLKLHVIICSTRPGRVGPSVAAWFHEYAKAHGGFDAELVDLADFNLPIYDEPVHPRMQQYEHEHTKRWSQSVAAADAYVFVTPEYNYSPPPSLVNALDYVYREWNYKPCGFVGYGGVSGGVRAVQMAKLHATTLKMVPLVEGVMVPMVASHINDSGVFGSNELIDASAKTMLDELVRWAEALRPLRS
ncbi:NADPH-dependent FMN reductase [Candidimonas nitroreducens]|uniref:NADPH-dependent FMN reductase n=1 Tax=Candidimonas nitroreducens TaxID=683354 RepID=A0A225M5Z7_9BURK|nr:NAD(P)H-dependent oxidoreductase [Candidimonas nitroreducens]OWT56747.1 NADPH-dependent FMN reductase [Candidimonas nitroreducens]